MPPERYLLLVDDDEASHFLSRRLLRKTWDALTIADAGDGEEACELITAQGPPALMLLDLRMPRMDGRGVLDWLESRRPGLAPAVFLLSSSLRPDDRELVERFSFVAGYLEKPLRRETIVSQLAPLLPPGPAS